MAKALKKSALTTAKHTGGFAADPRREQIFEMYRDLGPGRSYRKLCEAVGVRWPANPISLAAVANWAKKDGWQKRIEQYEKGLALGQGSAPAPATEIADGDEVAALERAASQALARALQASAVPVTKPGDVKALVDTASKALDLAERLKKERTGTATGEEIAAFGAKLMKRIDEARRKDFVALAKASAEAACEAAGLTSPADMLKVLKAAAGSLGLRVLENGQIEQSSGTAAAD